MKEWFSAKELAGLKGVSTHATNVTRQAKKQNWEMRALKGVKGGGLEYHISSLPPETQQALRLQAALAVVPLAEMTVQQPNLELSRKFNEASDKAREKAKAKAEACLYGEGHGQAKPIERAFGRGGIGEKVDKRPELAGFYWSVVRPFRPYS